MPALDTIKMRRGTAAAWIAANPTLADGEPGYEKDTGFMKIGDGVTAWNSLRYTFNKRASTGIWAPSDWGRTGGWSTSAPLAASSPILVADFGASIDEGYYSSSWATKTWKALTYAALQAAYGDGGSGFVSVHSTTGLGTGSASTITATGASGTGVGGWDAYTSGPNGYMLFAHAAANGATLVDTNVRGRFIDVIYLPTTTAGVTIGYAVSGGGPSGSIGTTVGSVMGIGKFTIDRGSGNAGVCTLTLTATGGQPFIGGWLGRNATGIIPMRAGYAGRTTGAVAGAPAVGLPTGQTTGYLSIYSLYGVGVPSLFMYSADMLINDIAATTTALAVGQNIAQAFDWAKLSNTNCDIVAFAPHKGNTADTTYLYQQYLRELRAVCEEYGAMLIDAWPIGYNVWSYWNGLGYWGDGTNDGLAGSNVVHPSDAGHQAMANILKPLLLAA